jgi:hypothetical protein
MAEETPKPAVNSKTLWFNVILGGLGMMDVIPVPDKWKIPILAGGNVILRILTGQPISGLFTTNKTHETDQ